MPLFNSIYTVTTYTGSSWESHLRSDQASTNYQSSSTIRCQRLSAKGSGTPIYQRGIIAFDLKGQTNRKLLSSILTLKTVNHMNSGSTFPCTIYAWTGDTPVYDECNWTSPSNTGSSWAGAELVGLSGLNSAAIDWPLTPNTVFSSADISHILAPYTGGLVYLIIKPNDETTTQAHPSYAIAHDEDDSETPVSNVASLEIASAIDHRNVFTRSEMTKFMSKKTGINMRSSVPSI